MNSLLLQLLICLRIGFASGFEARYLTFGFGHLHKVCEFDAKTLCEDFGFSNVEPTSFEDLKRLTHGKEVYPSLKYDSPKKGNCMWQALFNNKIQSEECVAALERRMAKTMKLTTTANRDGDVTLKEIPIPTKNSRSQHYYLIYHQKLLIWLNISVFLSLLYMKYFFIDSFLWRSSYDSMMCSKIARLALLDLIICALDIYDLLDPLYSLVAIFLYSLVVIFLFMRMLILVSGISSEEEEEEGVLLVDDKCYRRMGDEGDETMYVAVPLLRVV